MGESFDIRKWFDNRDKLLVISGPCSVESREQLLETAAGLSEIDKVKVLRGGIWKPRTRPDAFEGIGEVGLKWMQEAKQRYGFLTMTEVANPEHVELAMRYGIASIPTLKVFKNGEVVQSSVGVIPKPMIEALLR